MKIPLITLILSLVFPATLLHMDADASAPLPNIVFIMADDLGYSDPNCYGSKFYDTPNINQLAKQGMRFTNGYASSPNCAPTRAALMTGQYSPRTGVYTVGSTNRFNWRSRPLRPVDNIEELPLNKMLLPQALKQAGYTTGIIGKWHLGSQPGHTPTERGFDEFFGFLGGGSDYMKIRSLLRGTEQVEEKEYLTDAFGREAVTFIRKHQKKPFFLYLAFNAVHTPLQAPEKLKKPYNNKPPFGGQKNPTYAAMVASMDTNVGKVLTSLHDLGLEDRTLVIFSSDNGGVGGYQNAGIRQKDITDNSPLKGGKGMLYEGGIRIPYIFRWPSHIPSGSTCDQPINSVDLYPTLLEVAGTKRPTDYVLDGTSYLELLKGKTGAPRPPMFWHFPGYLGASGNTWRTTPCGVIRDGDWKLLEFFEDGHKELYNLKDDLSEKNNMAKSNPKKTEELYRKLVQWRQEMKAPMPQPHPPVEIQNPHSMSKCNTEVKREGI